MHTKDIDRFSANVKKSSEILYEAARRFTAKYQDYDDNELDISMNFSFASFKFHNADERNVFANMLDAVFSYKFNLDFDDKDVDFEEWRLRDTGMPIELMVETRHDAKQKNIADINLKGNDNE